MVFGKYFFKDTITFFPRYLESQNQYSHSKVIRRTFFFDETVETGLLQSTSGVINTYGFSVLCLKMLF